METLTVAFALTWPVLLGSSSLRALGLTRVEVTRKKMSRRNTMSVMDDIEMFGSALVVLLSAIANYSDFTAASSSSPRASMKVMVALSML